MAQKQKVQLVLASGGARGIAHIGVIQALEADGHEIVEVVGCSMGAVIGGIYACGQLDRYTEWLQELKQTDILKLMDFTLTRQGFLKGEKVFSSIMEMIGPYDIESLPIPFTALATDSETGEEIHFRKGDLYEALRASISIPGVFTPASYSGKQLLDGGVINPLPLNLIEKRPDAQLVAVNVNAPDLLDKEAKKASRTKSPLKLNWPFLNVEGKETSSKPNLVNLLLQSFDHMQNRLIDLTVQAYPPDLLIEVPRSTCGMFDFFKASHVIEEGHRAYNRARQQHSIGA